MQKPSIPKGTRDFSPEEMAKRNYIFNTIREVFHLYGFQQIETPAMENLSTLMGKYGEEGDKLLFKILNSGDCFAGISDEELMEKNPLRFAAKACEKGLRYDLTVPFARYNIVMRSVFRSNVTRSNRFGVPIVRKRDVTGSSTNVMATLWVLIP